MNFKERKYSQKKIIAHAAEMRKKCPFCDKQIQNHNAKQAKDCATLSSQPWCYSVEPDKMRKQMGL